MNTNNFYAPHNIELLFDFFGELGIKPINPYTIEDKNKVLMWVKKLLENKILYAGEYDDKKRFITWDISINEIIDKINNIWLEDMEFSKFYDIVWFKYQEWYIKELEKIGYNDRVDWNTFVESKFNMNVEGWVKTRKFIK